MAIKILETTSDLMTLQISGTINELESFTLEKNVSDLVKRFGTARLLIHLNDFQGWEKDGNWENMHFLVTTGKKITKMAFVGDPKWRDDIFLFTAKGLRSTEIEFYEPASHAAARSWLDE